jgi:hypothetical protein
MKTKGSATRDETFRGKVIKRIGKRGRIYVENFRHEIMAISTASIEQGNKIPKNIAGWQIEVIGHCAKRIFKILRGGGRKIMLINASHILLYDKKDLSGPLPFI